MWSALLASTCHKAMFVSGSVPGLQSRFGKTSLVAYKMFGFFVGPSLIGVPSPFFQGILLSNKLTKPGQNGQFLKTPAGASGREDQLGGVDGGCHGECGRQLGQRL